MQKLLASIVCFSLCAVLTATAGDKGAPKIEGAWNVTGGTFDGKKIPDEAFAKLNATLTFKEGKYISTIMGKQDESGTYVLDAKKTPAHMDLTILEGKDKGKMQVGLVKVEGDTMTFVVAKPGIKERPKDLEGGEGIAVTILKRGK